MGPTQRVTPLRSSVSVSPRPEAGGCGLVGFLAEGAIPRAFRRGMNFPYFCLLSSLGGQIDIFYNYIQPRRQRCRHNENKATRGRL
jgi:hypothetical protein